MPDNALSIRQTIRSAGSGRVISTPLKSVTVTEDDDFGVFEIVCLQLIKAAKKEKRIKQYIVFVTDIINQLKSSP
jgi:hypothetical protein